MKLSQMMLSVPVYRWLGVDHIHLIENDSSASIEADIADFINAGFVTFHTLDVPHGQVQAFQMCDSNYRYMYNWMMYVDADEFLHVRNRCGLSLCT
jgi:hypothetical protein